ncbi:MAG: tripartite tricarboxylate transporter substrate binding protein [Burkholderiaceae bacterium]
MNPNDASPSRRTLVFGAVTAIGAVAAVAAGVATAARAQSSRPLRLIVPFPPGGSTDILARAIGAKLGPAIGQTVVVDNKPGAGGSIGAAEAARAKPDGNTLLMGHIGTLAVNPALYPKLPYDPLKSFAPVAWVARVPNILVVNAGSVVKTLAELVAAAKAQPGRMNYSSGGNGSAAHIAFEYLKLKADFPMQHVPYRGTAPSVTDVLGGQVDATFTGAPAVLQYVRDGKLRALAVSSPQRLPTLPQVPTVAEGGYPDFDADQWYGVVAPAGTAVDVVSRLNAEINKTLQLPEVIEQFQGEGAIGTPTTPKAFGELIAREIPRWAEVVKAGNVKVE